MPYDHSGREKNIEITKNGDIGMQNPKKKKREQ
jgi:hypothetical protein